MDENNKKAIAERRAKNSANAQNFHDLFNTQLGREVMKFLEKHVEENWPDSNFQDGHRHSLFVERCLGMKALLRFIKKQIDIGAKQ